MPNKNDVQQEPQDLEPELNPREETSSLNELEQLRLIVFGEAQNRLTTQITTLRSDMEKALINQEKNFSEQLLNLQENTEKQFIELDNKLQVIDSIHDDNEGNLQKNIDHVGSEHDSFVATTQENFKSMEQLLSNESSVLTNNFNEQLEELKSYLENVSNDLGSSKTDRKTLASLLATMATNLQDESL